LTNNAVKFTEAGKVRIECKIENDNLEVSISDTGTGIKKENMDMLFDALGTGLGLHLCGKLVTLIGGRIWVESEYGKGSRFTFALPVRLKARGT